MLLLGLTWLLAHQQPTRTPHTCFLPIEYDEYEFIDEFLG
jgi:hypothetical protein